MRLFFDDHSQYNRETVAEVSIAGLLACRPNGVDLERVTKLGERFDRAVLHQAESETTDFLNAVAHPFSALLVTKEAGVPTKRAHVLLENPTRIILAVRRMAAFDEKHAWEAFLKMGEPDLRAIATHRFGDVSEDSKAALGFFIEHSEVIPALKILSHGFLAINARRTGNERWQARAMAAGKATWWQTVLDNVTLWTRDREQPYQSWRVLREADPPRSVDLLVERICLEGGCGKSELKAVSKLITKVATGKEIEESDVNAAMTELDATRF